MMTLRDKSAAPWNAATLAALCLVAAAVRLIAYKSHVFTIDEAFTWRLAQLPFGDLLKAAAAENHPPLFYLLAGLFARFAPEPEALRLVNIALQSACVPLVYGVFRRMADEASARAGVLLFVLSAFCVFYAQELRYPTLGMALFMGLLFLHSREDMPAWLRIVASGLLAAALALTFYIGALAMIAATAWLCACALRRREERAPFLMWLAGMALGACLCLPWVPHIMAQTGRQLGFVGWDNLLHHLASVPVGAFAKVLWEFSGIHYLPPVPALRAAWFAAWILCAVAGFLHLRKNILFRMWFAAACLTVVAAWLLMLTFKLYFFPKYFFLFAPGFYVCAAAGAVRIFKGRATLASGAVLALCLPPLLCFYATADRGPDSRDVLRRLGAQAKPGDVILVNPAYQSILFHAFYKGNAAVVQIPHDFDPARPYTGMRQVTCADLAAAATRIPRGARIYSFYSIGHPATRVDRQGLMSRWLESNLKSRGRTDFFISHEFKKQGRLFIHEYTGRAPSQWPCPGKP